MVKFLKEILCRTKSDNKSVKKYYLLGLLYCKESIVTLEKDIRLFGFSIYRKKLPEIARYKILANYLQQLKVNRRYIYNLSGCPSGELYIILNLFREIIKDKNEEDILFVVDKEFKYNLCKLYEPKIECLVVDNINLCFHSADYYSDEKSEIRSYFTAEHYLNQDVLINTSGEHYYYYILRDLGLRGEYSFKLPEASQSIKLKIQEYITRNNLGKFIIIAPEANTSGPLSQKFWENIIKELKGKRYQIFLNITKLENYIEGCVINKFNYEEIIELAKHSSGIIGLRSGLIEILSIIDVPKFVIYQGFPKRGCLKAMSSEKALSGFTLTKLPNVNMQNLFEYDINKMSERDLLLDFEKLESKERM